ncbi:MFS general substrate transporter [Cylindrobasidium torrendii FP15055 ss-10]|uniref:MFS general substrate transporter n=1 Tax=Cylindrobasidium torrendii FP15055 ss-10 TaxID=1314674 RepID=A0A0D7BHP8_9AGAR|nr:MFS general substrate transporter [Cylindrobasidium torrendii FP15055 ss-10]
MAASIQTREVSDVNERTHLLSQPITYGASAESGLAGDGSDSDTSGRRVRKKRAPTPLPVLQLFTMLTVQLVEPITSMSIYPYINQLISELDITGGDERRVGYYAGLIESLFFATEAVTVLHWGRLSDRIGRKPVLMIGLFGASISMLSFGLARTFWALVVARSISGLLNGNIGVMKSAMGDLTDSSNRADGFALLPVVWSFGATMGPLIGGTFARPHERFPMVFTGEFWIKYPYFLPCLIAASCGFACVLLVLFVFTESAPPKKRRSASYDSLETRVSSKQPPVNGLRGLLTYPVVLSVTNYATLAFLNISFNALFPLFASMPREIGGLEFQPSRIGYILGAYGTLCGAYQYLYFSKIIRRFGERKVFICGIAAYACVFALFPATSIVAGTKWQWVGLSAIIVLLALSDMAFGSIMIIITASAPCKASLGATNGLSQTAISIIRAIGPAFSASMFSVSVENNILYGYGVYALLFTFAILSLIPASMLPVELWEEADSDDED